MLSFQGLIDREAEDDKRQMRIRDIQANTRRRKDTAGRGSKIVKRKMASDRNEHEIHEQILRQIEVITGRGTKIVEQNTAKNKGEQEIQK